MLFLIMLPNSVVKAKKNKDSTFKTSDKSCQWEILVKLE